ncbi:radical SAM protein [Massilia pseudoviolaceinigra]|uniref:radical SAM protein n=1 Tax=Massilia pseudoviolaceinigra TaxID=3057165 RepID=UPI002796A11D|nr:radical SAM protein [Massilia sp. CCM 9206]MDQ1923593.1 radical SAM protein [Massilia sp. CCM 9206]
MNDTAALNYVIKDQLIYLRKVEVQVAFNCNLTCKGCVHGSPARPAKMLSPEEFARDLAALGSAARVHKLLLVGGEPLLHPDLVELLKLAKASGVAKYVCVTTNGVGLENMSDDFFSNVDSIEVSHYPRVRLRYTRDDLERKAQQFGFTFAISAYATFQETHLSVPLDDPALVQQIYNRCKPRAEWSCHTFAEGRYYMCPRSPILGERLGSCGQLVDNRPADGVMMRDNPDLFGDLLRYLQRDDPLEACKWCLGSDGASFPHLLQSKKAAIEEASRIVHFAPTLLSPRARAELAGLLAPAGAAAAPEDGQPEAAAP